ncbi:hypothetical protein [Flavobacterium sp. GSP27]|uniref:hypothetical protein n=1 Tax=Flavobacterium sp. GSP27 TaxID=2497489 RepID=UPI001315162A|nr:hypothetical protein [Flavobacterium sp. GSP27]
MIITITATTINIPTPTPALNIPPIIEQLENDISTNESINSLVNFFSMISIFNLKYKITGFKYSVVT